MTCIGEELTRLFIDNVLRLHGFPINIVSDRGPQFIAKFWKHPGRCHRFTQSISIAFHWQSHGQRERFNTVMVQYLCAYTTYLQDNWKKYLSLAEFTANNQVSESTKSSPFFANSRHDPLCPIKLTTQPTTLEELNAQLTPQRIDYILNVVKSEIKYA